ncbi:MAG: mechanosensitive ion channel family protein [Planctomycetota bacterium]|nr:mechanosensitive ion channel family protein [Planctomycetota bacterium]
MPEWFDKWLKSLEVLSWWEVLIYSVVAAFLVQFVVTRVVRMVTHRTKNELDDKVLSALRWPLFLTVLFVGFSVMLKGLEPSDPGVNASKALREAFQSDYGTWSTWTPRATSLMVTIAILFWMRAFMKISDAVLTGLARRVDDFKWIEPRTLPLFEIVTKLLIVGFAIYGLMSAWHIDLTAWLASAGILGIAIGFAAKDTLANLFAGIFILADAPYKLGDFIVLETGERGKVTDIGIRSTRILTRDDIEITLPNGLMANSKIINESSGPYVKRRLRVPLGIAYGSDVDKAREVMLEAVKACDMLAPSPPPNVRFRGFGDSALDFEVRGYLRKPVDYGRALDQVCTELNRALNEGGIEIPFPQRVLHVTRSDAAEA